MQHHSGSVAIAVLVSIAIVQPVWAKAARQGNATTVKVDAFPSAPLLHPTPDSATLNPGWIVQQDVSPVRITRVQVDPTATGVQLVLETANGSLAIPPIRTVGNALIVDFEDAAIADEIIEANPSEGIALVNITPLPDRRVRLAITGTNTPPIAEVTQAAQGLIFSVMSGAEDSAATEEPAIQVIATAEDNRYRVPDTSVSTRTNTPILDIPQSVQVIPQQVIEEQGANTVNETLRNAAGVSTGRVATDTQSLVPVIRGFETQNVLRNGLRDETFSFGGGTSITNIERVELLRGPASVLYGQGNLGGTLNLVTKQPLDSPQYRFDYTIGTDGQHRPSLDFTGPLSEDSRLAYRLNLAYETTETFREFEELESFFVAPIVRVINTEDTQLTLNLEYFKGRSWGSAPELPAVGTVIDNPVGAVEEDVNLGEPSLTQSETQVTRLGYQLEHRFSENLTLRNELLTAFRNSPESTFIIPNRLEPDQRTLTRLLAENPGDQQTIALNTQLVSTFSTGTVDHELLTGVEFLRETIDDSIRFQFLSPIDIFDPVYRPETVSGSTLTFGDTSTQTQAFGFYIQDQITVLEDVILVMGGRFDVVDQDYDDRLTASESFERQEEAFSPRLGIVYQPTDQWSLYASYTRSFDPVIGRARSLDPTTNVTIVGYPFEPERGTQYEVGVKADLLDGRLLTTLALYQLERTNVVTQGPDSPLSSVQVGEQRSRGVELNLAGELLPGWNILASYAYTDARITEDNQYEIGNHLPNAPQHAASLWTTYEIQQGDLAGLGFGLGLFFQGERPGDLNNSFDLPGYLRTDATVFYRRDRIRLALNVQNLFNVNYYEGARNDVRVIPGEPFTLSGNIRWEF